MAIYNLEKFNADEPSGLELNLSNRNPSLRIVKDVAKFNSHRPSKVKPKEVDKTNVLIKAGFVGLMTTSSFLVATNLLAIPTAGAIVVAACVAIIFWTSTEVQ